MDYLQENDQCYCVYEAASAVKNTWGDLRVSHVERTGFHLLASGRCTHICLGVWKVDLSFSFGFVIMGISKMYVQIYVEYP